MKQYFKRFMPLFICLLVFMLAAGIRLAVKKPQELTFYERTNTQCETEERVFDYADVLSDEEEGKLRELIEQTQEEVGCDIALVTLNEYIGSGESAVMNFADDFYEANKFGYDKAYGDGAVLVDNWYSGETYMWFSTSGRVENRYSDYDIDNLLDEVCDVVNTDPYKAYTRYIEHVGYTMSNHGMTSFRLSFGAIMIISFCTALFYVLYHLAAHKAAKTTVATTYVVGGRPDFKEQRDIFVTKMVTKRRIESSSSGGGGHHMSSGGHSHGGGGRGH